MMQNPATKYRAFAPVRLVDRNWPNRVIDRRADLDEHRPARRQPGAVRADERRKEDAHVQDALRHRLQGNRGRLPVGLADRVRLRAQLIEGGHIPDDVTIEVLTQAREHLIRRTFESITGARQAIVHVYNATSQDLPRQRVRHEQGRGRRSMAVDAVKLIRELADAMPETEDHPRIQPGTVHRHRTRFRPRSLRRGDRRLGRDAAAQGHPQPPDHGRDRHAQHLRRPDRVDAPQSRAPRQRASSASTRTTTAAPPSPPPNSASWPAPTASRAASSATASAPATSISSPSPSTCTRRASIPASTSPTSTPSPAPSNTAPSSRSTRATRTSAISFSRPSPAPTRTPSRRGLPLKRRMSNGRCPISRSTRPTSAAATTR